jgi:Tol biopolymer transport system component
MEPGTRFGPYEVISRIGAGGMGEVYRARDSTLHRDVALKILPAAFVADADRAARFVREAQSLAALNHPHIAQIYGVEGNTAQAAAGEIRPQAIVMELVEGEDLSVRIARGPLPLDEALPIARQVALALEAAHDAGIVHRDLKPANIKIRTDGTVKVLDFGLAKAVQGDRGTPELSPSNSPTLTARATEMGMILGTAAYMAPEQVKGRVVDRRADVWAFGVVLYEMLTGRRAFAGDDVTEVLAAVLRDSPPLDALPADTPVALRRLLRRCLEKDPRKRLRDMGDAGVEIDEAIAGSSTDDAGAVPAVAGARPWKFIAAGVAILGVIATVVAWELKPAPRVDAPITRFTITLNEGDALPGNVAPNLAISPDGRRLAWRTTGATCGGIYVRALDALEAREVARSPGAGLWFSSDGQSLLYTTLTGLTKVSLSGGAPQEVVTIPQNGGVHWSDDGTIVYSTLGTISRVAESGGAPEVLIHAGAGLAAWPQLLPGGRTLLYTAIADMNSEPNTVARSLGDGTVQVVLKGRGGARYLNSGHLIYGAENRLFAVPFDPATLRVMGPEVALPESVAVSTLSLWAMAAIAANGTMAYIGDTGLQGQSQLVWADEHGRTSPALTAPRVYSDPKLSPDGKRVALHLWDEDNDVWIGDLVRGGLTRMTFSPTEDETPVWSPDGMHIAYASQRTGQPRTLYRKAADGGAAAAEHQVWQNADHFHVNDWSPDGRTIVVEIQHGSTANDLHAIDVQTGRDTPLLASPYKERQARFSPDGNWLAYTSDESRRDEVYVQPYPSLDRRVAVSTAGGYEPVWSRDGKRLYFRTQDSLMVAAVASASPLAFSAPRPLFGDRFVRAQGDTHTHFDVDAAGRLLLAEAQRTAQTAPRMQIQVVLNWIETVKQMAPAR